MDLKRLRKSRENEENGTEMKTVAEKQAEEIEEPVAVDVPNEIELPEAFPGESVESSEEDLPVEHVDGIVHTEDSYVDASQIPSVCGSDFEFVN